MTILKTLYGDVTAAILDERNGHQVDVFVGPTRIGAMRFVDRLDAEELRHWAEIFFGKDCFQDSAPPPAFQPREIQFPGEEGAFLRVAITGPESVCLDVLDAIAHNSPPKRVALGRNEQEQFKAVLGSVRTMSSVKHFHMASGAVAVVVIPERRKPVIVFVWKITAAELSFEDVDRLIQFLEGGTDKT